MTTSRQGHGLLDAIAADRRMAEEDRGVAQLELLLAMVDENLPDMGHARRAVPLARQRGHWLVAGPGANMAERQQVGRDVEKRPVPADPVAHRRADAADHPTAGPDAGPARPRRRRHTEIVERPDEDVLQAIEKRLHAEVEPVERQDGIDGQLTGQMKETAAAAIHPAHAPAPVFEGLVVEQDVGMAALPADAD